MTNTSFDPEAIKMLAAAFDDAWEAVQRSGGSPDHRMLAPFVRSSQNGSLKWHKAGKLIQNV
jgi:hypothetical protein